MVKDEADILPAWLAHAAAVFDEVYLVDHNSKDGTQEIMLQYAEKRKNFQLYSLPDDQYSQAEVINDLAGRAAAKHPDAWIIPLDGDEFLWTRSHSKIINRLAQLDSIFFPSFPWFNLLPLSLGSDSEIRFSSPYLFQPGPSQYSKTGIHSQLVREGYRLSRGGHYVIDQSGTPAHQGRYIHLCPYLHLPFRSYDQFFYKCLLGYDRYAIDLAESGENQPGFHYRSMITRIIDQGYFDPGLLRSFVAHYGQPEHWMHTHGIQELLAMNWRIQTIDCVQEEVLPEPVRRKNYRDLINIRNHKYSAADDDLQPFIRIVQDTEPH